MPYLLQRVGFATATGLDGLLDFAYMQWIDPRSMHEKMSSSSVRTSTESFALLVAHLQLDDVRNLLSGWKGKARHDVPLTDAQQALLLTENVLEAEIQRICDHRLALMSSGLDVMQLDGVDNEQTNEEREGDGCRRLPKAGSFGTELGKGTYQESGHLSNSSTSSFAATAGML
jgi:hypothetical protein